MKILVTGGSGFIGGHLIARFLELGHEVVNLDMRKSEKCDTFLADILDYEKIVTAFDGMDVVVHLAAQISVPVSIKDPVKDAEINVMGTANVLRACIGNKVKKIIFTSSAAVYGSPKEFPIKESTEPEPISPYGASKLTAERYCNMFSEMYGLNAIIFRMFNIYGKGASGIIPKLLAQLEESDKLTYRGGSQTRDYIYIRDLISAFELALEKDISGVFNIATGTETSLDELVEKLEKINGKKYQIEKTPVFEGDIKRSLADISKANKELGFKPKYDLEEGLRALLK